MLKKRRFRLIHLHRCRGISRQKLRKLLQKDPSLQMIYQLSSSQISRLLSIKQTLAEELYNDIHDQSLLQEMFSDLRNYQVVTIIDEHYPPMLKTIKDPPLVLYVSGDISLFQMEPSLSVIGTRNPSQMANFKMKFIVTPLVKENWIIVSGMAKGIDSYAHKLALHYKGKTIAVLGSGFHHIYPKENMSLYRQIEQNGVVISEYPPNTPPRPYHFPERNRIISGLSYGTLVIEATERSGTLITVDQALDQGREVYAVPGSPHIPQSFGCLQLIEDGARLVKSAQDILLDWEEQSSNWVKKIDKEYRMFDK